MYKRPFLYRLGVVFLIASLAADCRPANPNLGRSSQKRPPQTPPGRGGWGGALLIKDYLSLQGHFPTLS